MKNNDSISDNLKLYAAKHNLRVVKTKNGIKFEDAKCPMDISAVIAYVVIGLGVIFGVCCFFFSWN